MGKGSLGKGLPDRVCSLMRVSRVSIVYLPPVFGPRGKGLFERRRGCGCSGLCSCGMILVGAGVVGRVGVGESRGRDGVAMVESGAGVGIGGVGLVGVTGVAGVVGVIGSGWAWGSVGG